MLSSISTFVRKLFRRKTKLVTLDDPRGLYQSNLDGIDNARNSINELLIRHLHKFVPYPDWDYSKASYNVFKDKLTIISERGPKVTYRILSGIKPKELYTDVAFYRDLATKFRDHNKKIEEYLNEPL